METNALNDSYTKGMERSDREKFSEWNSITRLFTITAETAVGEKYDVIGTLKDGRQTIIELKSRNCNHDQYYDLMIEGDKLADGLLYQHFDINITALYINFYSDGWVSVVNLKHLKHQPRKQKVRRENPGLDGKVENAVYFINALDAVFYDDGGRVHRTGV